MHGKSSLLLKERKVIKYKARKSRVALRRVCCLIENKLNLSSLPQQVSVSYKASIPFSLALQLLDEAEEVAGVHALPVEDVVELLDHGLLAAPVVVEVVCERQQQPDERQRKTGLQK